MTATASISELRAPSIGPFQLRTPFVQAALSGYSDWPMRVLARRFGASYALCEVLLDQFVLQLKGRERTKHHLKVTADEHPVGGQLMGSSPEEFGPAAVRLMEAGFSVIDINFGCPVKKVLGRCRGGYHLSQPAVALEIVRRVRDSLPDSVPVTLKMRRGIDDSAESRDRFFEILDGAFAAGVSAITVHGRTVEQKYIGPSRWSFLREVKDHVGDRTILGSGDLFSAQACLDMMRETGVDGVTIARGAIGNPWIFQQAEALWNGEPLPPPPTVHQQRDVLEHHFALALETYGPERCTTPMRKFGVKYAKLHPQLDQVRAAFCIVKTPADWAAVLRTHYASDGPGQYPDVDDSASGESCEV
ncbi:putative tRNA-dihydrouridine synthase [Caulifigura coniformis]|uniref:tRNA-dihydrouridine synthase n=1 Tax=Caulifigura coniformis TaxID=2527983 RepID=A0A517SML5_9PLAN|nr:tRNA-dihydrouridine synthase [Caulifigura coniformis]QDT57370.1 putative tRNA-dihydrouridine synthase [Caulifigura coniformis]